MRSAVGKGSVSRKPVSSWTPVCTTRSSCSSSAQFRSSRSVAVSSRCAVSQDWSGRFCSDEDMPDSSPDVENAAALRLWGESAKMGAPIDEEPDMTKFMLLQNYEGGAGVHCADDRVDARGHQGAHRLPARC